MNELAAISKYTPDQVELITRTVAKGATQDELKLFLYRCELLKLNPLKPGQIHFIKYGQSPGTVVVGIEGFRSNAGRTGKHVSTTRGVTKENGTIVCGWARVKRRDEAGEVQEYYEETPFGEYYNDRNNSWKKMPETMIKKVAEAACLRMAYPDQLGGIYIPEEEDKIKDVAGSTSAGIHPNQPDADEAPYVGPFIVKIGKMSGRTVEECARVFGIDHLKSAIPMIEERIKNNKPYANTTIESLQKHIDEFNAHIKTVESK